MFLGQCSQEWGWGTLVKPTCKTFFTSRKCPYVQWQKSVLGEGVQSITAHWLKLPMDNCATHLKEISHDHGVPIPHVCRLYIGLSVPTFQWQGPHSKERCLWPRFLWLGRFSICITSQLTILALGDHLVHQQQQHSLLSQASWGRLEMKPKEIKITAPARW